MNFNIIEILVVLVFGTIIGSFLNVVIIRFQTGKTIARGRSMCMSCGKTLLWYELIPVVSYLFLRGKCSSCRTEISAQYPVVEWGTAILFLISFLAVGPISLGHEFLLLVFLWLQFSALIVISGYDARHNIIPSKPLIFLFIVSLVQVIFASTGVSNVLVTIMERLLYGALLFLPFYLLWRFSKGTWMGFGDGKLAFVIGFMLPGMSGLSAILFAFYVAAAVAVSLMLSQRINRVISGTHGKKALLTMKSEVPFGPFLALGAVSVSLYEAGCIFIGQFLPFL